MTFRGSMPPGQPFHGQQPPHPAHQQHQQHQQHQHQQQYVSYGAPSQQLPQLQQQHLPQHQQHQHQHHQGQYGVNSHGGAGYPQQQYYGAGGGQQSSMQYMPTQQHQIHQNSAAHQSLSGQYGGFGVSGYDPYTQQPAAAQYMPPPQVWQQQQQQQTSQYRQQQQPLQPTQHVQQHRMEPMRASPIQQYDQLPHAQSLPNQQQQQQYHPQVLRQHHQQQQQQQQSQQQSISPRYANSVIPQLPAQQSMSPPPVSQSMPQPPRAAPPYRPSPTQPSPKTVPAPQPRRPSLQPRPQQISQNPSPTPPPPPSAALANHTTPSQPVVPDTISNDQLTSLHPPPVETPVVNEREPPPLAQEPSFESFQFVNLQDIQHMPFLPPPPPVIEPSKIAEKQAPIAPAIVQSEQTVPKTPKTAEARGSPYIKTEDLRDTAMKDAGPIKPKRESSEPSYIKASPHSSVAASPALSSRSLSISKKSPALPNKSRPGQSVGVLVAVADELLAKARSAVHDVAMSLHPERLEEYQKLISISVGCLESAMQSGRMTPRQEARLRLRYATLLYEETENVMECETTLSKGITLCDNHRLHDLKYSSQYLLLRVLFNRNRKAALKALDGHISDCETYKHINWYYAFRLLKAALCMEAGIAAEANALENLRALQNMSNQRGDNALNTFAYLLEALTLIRAAKDVVSEKVQACLAQIAKHQFDPTIKIPQVEVLALLVDVVSNLYYYDSEVTAEKLGRLQRRLDDCKDWGNVKSEFLIPIRRSASSGKTVSSDTATVLRAGEAESEFDYLVMSFMTKVEFTSLVFTIGGLTNFMRPSPKDSRKTVGLWQEGLSYLERWNDSTAGIPYGPPVSLTTALRQKQWRADLQKYLDSILGLTAASLCDWDKARDYMQRIHALPQTSGMGTLDTFVRYLQGVYLQGTGDPSGAIAVFQEPCFRLPDRPESMRFVQGEMAILATLNRLWIMQHPYHRNNEETMQLMEELQPLCVAHPNINVRTAWHDVTASLVTEPQQQLSVRKNHIQLAMKGAKTPHNAVHNILHAAITLCIMSDQLFESVVGEQALKCAQAAAVQAQRSGNVLWGSVADGLLARSFETQGRWDEARREHERGAGKAATAFGRRS